MGAGTAVLSVVRQHDVDPQPGSVGETGVRRIRG